MRLLVELTPEEWERLMADPAEPVVGRLQATVRQEGGLLEAPARVVYVEQFGGAAAKRQGVEGDARDPAIRVWLTPQEGGSP